MPKSRPSRTALRRRARAERDAPHDYSRDILRELERAGAPLSPDELAHRLRARRGERRIAALAGRIEGHHDGHGFLIPDDGSKSVFLPPHEMRDLMHGDRASVRVTGSDNRGRPVGALVEVLERSQRRIVGRMHLQHGVSYLVPEDRRIAHDIVVPEPGKTKPGQVVTVELVQQPTKHAQPVGRIAEVLGNYADSGMEIEIALRKFDLPHEFPKKALAQAQGFPDVLQQKDLQGRRDLRDLEFVTIDGETAKDFDDAVYARREGRDWRLWVAIADVSH